MGLLLVVVAYLMVSTWRFYSFKDIDLRARHPFRLIVSSVCFLPQSVITHRSSCLRSPCYIPFPVFSGG
jgi:phosphatidylserine synthase